MRNAILRLVRDVWKFGLREGLGWAAMGTLAWVPQAGGGDGRGVGWMGGGLTPSPHPAFPLRSQPQPVFAMGNRMAPFRPGGPSALVSRADRAKARICRAKP